MSSTSIGPELDNDDNEKEKPEVDKVEEDQASVPLNKKKNDKDDVSITQPFIFSSCVLISLQKRFTDQGHGGCSVKVKIGSLCFLLLKDSTTKFLYLQ